MIKDISRLVRPGLLAIAVTLTLAACGTQQAGNPPPDVETTDTSGSPSDSSRSPDTEGTGPEKPRPTDDGTSVSFPHLPAGEDNYDDSQVRQCMTVKWLGQMNIPDGVSVQVKAVRITPTGIFTLSNSSCRGVRACTNSFAFTSAKESCSVSITATAKNKVAYLRLAGRCVSRDAQQCAELLADDGSPITLRQPRTDEESQEDPPPDEDPPSQELPPTSEEDPPPSTS